MDFSVAIFVLFSLSATCNGDYPTGAIQAIRCTLFRTEPEDCTSLPEVSVPSYLILAYNDSPSLLHNALRMGKLSQLTDGQVASLPLSLLYLIPRNRLKDLNGTQLGIILQKHIADTGLARQITSSLQHTRQLLQFLFKLKASPVPQDVARVVGEGIKLSDLNDNFLKMLPELEEPILAYLPPAIYLSLNRNSLYAINFRLNMKYSKYKIPTKPAIRVIAQASIKHGFPLTKIYWMVSGLTSDEIKNDSLTLNLETMHLKLLDLDNMQARAMFERYYQNRQLHQGDYIDSMPVLSKLSPVVLQKFPIQEHKYDTINSLPLPRSLPTACQLAEYVKADCKRTGKLPNEEDEPWETRIHYMNQWVYTLPLETLREYLYTPLDTAYLRSVQSAALSPVQAYYLTGRGEALNAGAANSLVDLDTMLHALPASQLVSRGPGDVSSTVLEHLAAYLPAGNMPRTLALVNKIASKLDQEFILKNLLENPDLNSIFSLVSPKDLKAAGLSLIRWSVINPDSMEKIRQLPQPILAALLQMTREEKKDNGWSWQFLLDKKQDRQLLGGLTCEHIGEMDTGLFIPIIALYNRQQKQSFPKNLQQCCLRKLMDHLQLKMTLTQTHSDLGLISVLEPVEIESLGGFVLAGLPIAALKASDHLDLIIAAIGKLSNIDLLRAANITHLQAIAELALKQDGIVDVFTAGNLVWFLPPESNIPYLRLMLEAKLLDTTICMPNISRRSLATKLLSQFGPADSWSGGVLATLQDLMIVFTEEEIENVSKSAWTEAADCLSSHYADDVHLVSRTPFYQFCSGLLGESEEGELMSAVRRLTRQLLSAAQWQLDTVLKFATAKSPTHMFSSNFDALDHQTAAPMSIFSPDLETTSSSTTETSTTETSTTEASTTESSTTESSTTESSTTESSTTETSTTEQTSITAESITSSTEVSSISYKTTTNKPTTVLSTSTHKPATTFSTSIHKSTTGFFINSSTAISIKETTEKSKNFTETINASPTGNSMDQIMPIVENGPSTVPLSVGNVSTTTSDSYMNKSMNLNVNDKDPSNSSAKSEKSSENPIFSNETATLKPEKETTTNDREHFKNIPSIEHEDISDENYINEHRKNNNQNGEPNDKEISSYETITTEININKEDSDDSPDNNSTPPENFPQKQKFSDEISTFKPEQVTTLNESEHFNSIPSAEYENIFDENYWNKHNKTNKNTGELNNEEISNYETITTKSNITGVHSDDSQINISTPPEKLSQKPKFLNENSTLKPEKDTTLNDSEHFNNIPLIAYEAISVKNDFNKHDEINKNTGESNDKEISSYETITTNTNITNVDSDSSQSNISTPRQNEKPGFSVGGSDFDTKLTVPSELVIKSRRIVSKPPNIKDLNENGHKNYIEGNINSTIPTNFLNDSKVHNLTETSTDELMIINVDLQGDSNTIINGSEVVEENMPVETKRKKRYSVPSFKLTCNAMKMVGKQAGLVITKADLKEMSNSDIEDCKVEFGAMDLSFELQKEIWKRISYNDGIHLLGNLLQAVAVPDLWDLKFNAKSPWALENIHAITSHYNTRNDSLIVRKLLHEVQSNNDEMIPELVAALGPYVCGLESLQLSFTGVGPWPEFLQCPTCLPQLALAAIHQLGPVAEWTQHYVHSLHVIVAGLDLDSWKVLIDSPHKPLVALQPSAVRCLNISHLEILGSDHISMIPTVTLHTLSQQQMESFNTNQLEAFKNATELTVPENLLAIPKNIYYVAGVPSIASLTLAPAFSILTASLALKCLRVV